MPRLVAGLPLLDGTERSRAVESAARQALEAGPGAPDPADLLHTGWWLGTGKWLVRELELAWEHELPRVLAVTYPQNAPSQAVCRRLGLTALGRTDRYYDVDCDLFSLDRP